MIFVTPRSEMHTTSICAFAFLVHTAAAITFLPRSYDPCDFDLKEDQKVKMFNLAQTNFGEWNDALKSLDPDRVSALYAKDVSFLPTLSDEFVVTGSGVISAAKLDITSKDSISSLISELMNRYGRIDAVVNNAYPRNKKYGRKSC